jgi:Bacterial pre-peptidase C-terminal domain
VLEKYQVNQYLRGTTFDPDSIMLYAFPGTWTQSGQGTKLNQFLSAADKEFIASRDAYPQSTVEAVMLQVSATPVEGRIGKPGEEDIYHFTVAMPGPHIVETGGNTDVVMKLFGPDSQTNLIAEDDDSGAGSNSRIVAELSTGQYFIQIRHYNKAQGTGVYSIGVKK